MVRIEALNNPYAKVILFSLLAVGLFIIVNPGYLIIDTFTWIGILTLPITFRAPTNTRTHRFFWPTLGIVLLSIILKSTFGAYCSMIFFILLTIEMYAGKLSLISLFHLLLLSPLFKYFSSLISFPLRMQISKIIAVMLQAVGMDIELSGNLITFNGTEFLVDKACMGLYMLGYSFLFGLIILAGLERTYHKLSFRSIALFMILLLVLNFLSNIGRATTLIIFKIMPESWLHDIFGLLIFILCVLLPFYWISLWWKKRKHENQSNNQQKKYRYATAKFSLILILYLSSLWQNRQGEQQNQNSLIHLPGYTYTILDNHVAKFSNDKALIYIKPPVAPYKADHNPLICWQGSGYSFKKINYKNIGNRKVHLAELIKGGDKLYSAWWFQSDSSITSNQWEWRWNTLTKHHQYSMINITCATMEELESSCSNFLQNTIQSKSSLTKK
ncbi:exosortase N [Fulvivirga sp. 29W222]|uniref:Exosortase N n=1 Tax=Fulvivirga marina TaxID=2494733 RepID=A0A937G0P6_9BACT|nr:exosortase N [Fulvivirga marina]MBL6447840.1 exosortase N [Fulvivirga marina]